MRVKELIEPETDLSLQIVRVMGEAPKFGVADSFIEPSVAMAASQPRAGFVAEPRPSKWRRSGCQRRRIVHDAAPDSENSSIKRARPHGPVAHDFRTAPCLLLDKDSRTSGNVRAGMESALS